MGKNEQQALFLFHLLEIEVEHGELIDFSECIGDAYIHAFHPSVHREAPYFSSLHSTFHLAPVPLWRVVHCSFGEDFASLSLHPGVIPICPIPLLILS